MNTPATLEDIPSLTGYLKNYGPTLARKAIKALRPLHIPGRDALPNFEDYPFDRTPLPAQQHVAAAAIQTIDKHGTTFIIGEPGCGKTITAIAAIHEHAMRSRRKGGYGGKYRAIVICPDTLVEKWAREIETTIVDAHVITIGRKKDKWSDVLSLVSDKQSWHDKRWTREHAVEWLVLGRDKIKLGAAFTGLGDKRRCMDGQLRENKPCRLVEVDRKEVLDSNGFRTYKPGTYTPLTKGVYEKRLACPKCGKIPMEKGKPVKTQALTNKATTCDGLILREVTKTGYGNDVIYETMKYMKYKGFSDDTFPSHARRVKPGARISHAGKSYEVQVCGEPLFQFTRKPNKWPAANLVQRKLKRWANYMVIDECHQAKGEGSAQAIAMGKVLSTTKHALALTGTFIGGYADHLFPILIRMAGAEMKARGFTWGSKMPFVERYGCIDRIVSGTVPVSTSTKLGGSKSLAKKIGNVNEDRKPRPGIMPTLFSHLVMKRSIFLKLDQFIDNLPGFEEKMRPVEMDSDIQAEYNRFAGILEGECSKMLASGNMKLLGTMLWTLLSYPDCPFDWVPRFEGDQAVGWWRQPKVYTQENFVGVVTPRNFEMDRILPKEQAVIDLCKDHANKNEQTWVYTLLSKVHSPVDHLQAALAKEGLRVGVLRSDDASPSEREAYINKVGRNVDVMISHPGLVATGLDLFSSTVGKHNFNNLAFFQTGYDLFTIRQASRRGWRIGQDKDCTVNYFYYLGTMQATAMALISRKMLAAMQLEEGSISEEGLAAMGGGGSDQAALINAISNVIDPKDIERNWGKTSGGTGRKFIKPVASAPAEAEEDEADEEVVVADLGDLEFDEEACHDEAEFEAEQLGEQLAAATVVDEEELTEDDFDFNEDDLADMFAGLKTSKGDELDW